MVGGEALRCALDHPAVGDATAIGRKPTGLAHPKLKEVLHQDFADCSALAGALTDKDAAVFCLGAYTGAVPDAELRRVTVDYAVEFARVLRASSPNTTFAFLSGGGADTDRAQPDRLRTLQGRGRERTVRGRISPFVHLPPRVHLPCAASPRTQFWLSPAARDLSRISGVVPQPGDSCRRPGPNDGGRRHGRHWRRPNAGSREP